jgi:hypothetical protein
MSASEEAVVRRFYEQMNNERKNDLAHELFTADHRLHDPQSSAEDGSNGVAAEVAIYQDSVDGHWDIEEIFSAGDRVVVRGPARARTSESSTASRRPARRCASMRSLFTVWPAARSPRPGRSGTRWASYNRSVSSQRCESNAGAWRSPAEVALTRRTASRTTTPTRTHPDPADRTAAAPGLVVRAIPATAGPRSGATYGSIRAPGGESAGCRGRTYRPVSARNWGIPHVSRIRMLRLTGMVLA